MGEMCKEENDKEKILSMGKYDQKGILQVGKISKKKNRMTTCKYDHGKEGKWRRKMQGRRK